MGSMAEAEVEILLRLAGVNPNSEAIRIMISVCRLAIARYGDCTGNPEGDLIIEPYSWIASIASAQSAYAPQCAARAPRSKLVVILRGPASLSHSRLATSPSSGGHSGTCDRRVEAENCCCYNFDRFWDRGRRRNH